MVLAIRLGQEQAGQSGVFSTCNPLNAYAGRPVLPAIDEMGHPSILLD